MSKPKFSTELKIRACEDFLSGKYSAAKICEKYGITYNEKTHSSSSLNEWVAKYRVMGSDAFTNSQHNKISTFSISLKQYEYSECKEYKQHPYITEYLPQSGILPQISVPDPIHFPTSCP